MRRSSTFNLTIPNPCERSWDEMKPAINGRFCSNCKKTVIDFTKLSDEEARAVILTSTTKICGRFDSPQLDRISYQSQKKHQNNLIPVMVVTSALIAGVQQNSMAAGKNVYRSFTESVMFSQPMPANFHLGNDRDTLPVIAGRVTEGDYGQGLAGVSVYIKNTSQGVLTNQDGNFRLNIPEGMALHEVILMFSAVGFATEELKGSAITSGKMTISMQPITTMLTGEVIVVRKPTPWQKVKRLFR